MNRKNARASFVGALIFFLTIAAAVTVSMLTYSLVNEKTGGDTGTIALVMFLVVLFLSTLCTSRIVSVCL